MRNVFKQCDFLYLMAVALVLITSLVVLGDTANAQRDEPSFHDQPVFVSGTEGVNIFRIPSVIALQSGDVLAFAEAREGGDKSPTDLVMRRSTNGGDTWGEMVAVLPGKPGAIMNPTPVVERQSGRLVMLCNCIYKEKGIDQIWLLASDDGGNHWTKPEDLTEKVGPFHPGPGIGIQTRSGRLVIPGRCQDNRGGAAVIFSDDGGKSWELGEPAGPKTNESQVVELSDGRLMLNMRSNRGKGCRAVAISDNGGESWGDIRDDTALIEPVCQASILRYQGKNQDDKAVRILFANPARSRRSDRNGMTVRMSTDDGQRWPASREIHSKGSSYSCLTNLPDGRLGLLYERQERRNDRWHMELWFARFNLSWLQEKEQ